MATSQSSSSSLSAEQLDIRRTNHLITISHPHHPYYLVCILHFRDSLFVWLGEAPTGAVAEAQRSGIEQESNGGASADEYDLLARAKASLSEEDQRQLEVDRQMEEELSKALAAAGRDAGGGVGGVVEEDEISRQAKGFLAKEWAVAMYKEGLVSRCKAKLTQQHALPSSCVRLADQSAPSLLPRGFVSTAAHFHVLVSHSVRLSSSYVTETFQAPDHPSASPQLVST